MTEKVEKPKGESFYGMIDIGDIINRINNMDDEAVQKEMAASYQFLQITKRIEALESHVFGVNVEVEKEEEK